MRLSRQPGRLILVLTAATISGVAASLPFSYIYLARPQEAHWSHLAIVFGGLFGGGAGYARLVAAARGGSLSARAAVAGASLVFASVVGIAAGFTAEPGISGLTLPTAFALVFPPIVGCVALAYALALGWSVGVVGVWRVAVVTAVVAGVAVLAVILATDPLSGWRVGGGDRAMIRVAWLATLLGGASAGALYLTLVLRRDTPR